MQEAGLCVPTDLGPQHSAGQSSDTVAEGKGDGGGEEKRQL
jgi:hypothetical protein